VTTSILSQRKGKNRAFFTFIDYRYCQLRTYGKFSIQQYFTRQMSLRVPSVTGTTTGSSTCLQLDSREISSHSTTGSSECAAVCIVFEFLHCLGVNFCSVAQHVERCEFFPVYRCVNFLQCSAV
jgi:hypothetical protein